LIVLRHALQTGLEKARAKAGISGPAPSVPAPTQVAGPRAVAVQAAPAEKNSPPALEQAIAKLDDAIKIKVEDPAPSPRSEIVARPAGATPPPTVEAVQAEPSEDDDYLKRCVDDITEQLRAMPAKSSPSVSAIVLGGCKLLVATWEAQAFFGEDALSKALQRTVAARTILYVCMERHKKGEATDLTFALEIAQAQVQEMKAQVEIAKESKNIDAAVNLAATAKRLLSLIADGEKLVA